MKNISTLLSLLIGVLLVMTLASCNINLLGGSSSSDAEQSQVQNQQSRSQNVQTPSQSSSVASSQSSSKASSSSVAPSSQEQSLPSSSSSSETITSKIVPVGDGSLSFPSDTHAGTQEELDDWYSLIGKGSAARINVCNMNDSEAELSEGQFNSIMKTLAGANLSVYEALGNPMTGGAVHVVAYNSADNKIWHVVYNGEWFMVDLGSGSASIFNGEGAGLDDLFTIF